MQKVEDSIALVICTRNRPEYMSGLLQNLEDLNALPRAIIVVDSSEDDSTFNLLSRGQSELIKTITYLGSAPGLPYQRNIGIKHIISTEELNQIELISFTDDDCRLSLDYFHHLSAYASTNSNFSAITGTLAKVRRAKPNLWRRFFCLDSLANGVVLKSGYTTTVECSNNYCQVEWIPGGSMSIKRNILESIKFDNQLRMYGEDLKMSLKLREHGPLIAISKMEYQHLEATSGKDNLVDVIGFTDGIRWQLSREFPKIILRRYILWSINGSVIANSIKYIKSRGGNQESKQILFGHFRFLFRLVSGKSYIQVNQQPRVNGNEI